MPLTAASSHTEVSHTEVPYSAAWHGPATAFLAAGLALTLYLATTSTDITWAHHGADGGELLAAARVNGVPHPPGYPLYTFLLRQWLILGDLFVPASTLAWRGNLFSALLAAAAVGMTVPTAGLLLRDYRLRWAWAGLAGLVWAVSPLLWSKAIITEVYALHALALALLGWVVLVRRGSLPLMIPIVAIGVANHLTFFLLLPAAFYYLWATGTGSGSERLQRPLIGIGAGCLVGALIYLRIPLAAAGSQGPPPINWGYADNWSGLWWLVSGQAYRGYLFSLPTENVLQRIAGWAQIVTQQYMAPGLLLALLGLSHLDRYAPKVRTFGLIWITPVSIYAISYFTRDSEIYLLPVGWIMALWLALGAAVSAAWLTARLSSTNARLDWPLAGFALAAMLALTLYRAPQISLHDDDEAAHFLRDTIATIEPDSILVTNLDSQTFAVWYGAWGNGELMNAAPGAIVVNYSLYQFEWYRRLLGDLYPEVVGIDESFEALLLANSDRRKIYFTEPLTFIPVDNLQAAGRLWRYQDLDR